MKAEIVKEPATEVAEPLNESTEQSAVPYSEIDATLVEAVPETWGVVSEELAPWLGEVIDHVRVGANDGAGVGEVEALGEGLGEEDAVGEGDASGDGDVLDVGDTEASGDGLADGDASGEGDTVGEAVIESANTAESSSLRS